MSNIQFDNFETLDPLLYTVHVLRTLDDGVYAYVAEIMMHFNAEPKSALFLPTRISESTAARAATLALTHTMSLLAGAVSALVMVIDVDTNTVVEELDLRELQGARLAMGFMPPPDGTTIH